MLIPRYYVDLEKYLEAGKVLIIYGPRQVGKTTLLEHFLKKTNLKYRLDTGDDIRIQEVLGSQDLTKILEYAQSYDLVAIDEAQHIPNIGMGLKLLVDHRPDLKIIATGSSSFDLASQIGEPLTGRKKTLKLFPVAQLELLLQKNSFDLKQELENYLIFGSYPAVLTASSREEKIEILNEIANSYLLKDVFALEKVKAPKALFDLLKLLAFQVGSEVSYSELGQSLGLEGKTVKHYLDLLEKAFVLINLRGFSRNLRKEVTKKSKYYFYDTGLRNSIIANFNTLDLRNDVGALWENFLVIERLKKQEYQRIYSNNYFWRTWEQKEIDWVEEREGKLFAYEFKWSERKIKPPRAWVENYPEAEFEVIGKENYLKFVT